MASARPVMILPVENLVREMDAKILLACVAAERGFECIVGSRTQVDFCVGRFPSSIYFSKSMTPKSALMFKILRLLGSDIVVQDEECMAYNTLEHYHASRLSPETLSNVSMLFAWGPDSRDMLRKYPSYPGTPIHTVGSPRVDLLRPELREAFADDVRGIRERFGRFVLINSNFAMVNGFYDSFNVLQAPAAPGAEPALGAAGFGATREFAVGYSGHRTALFEAFKALVPALCEEFPDRTFIVRPHPSEKQLPWVEASRFQHNLHVVHEGSVVPWLLAADALIHNGCTTAVEAAVLGTPVLSYRPLKSAPYDADFPNALSHEATTIEELFEVLSGVLDGTRGQPVPGANRLKREFIAALDGPLASERIIDALLCSDAIRHGLARPTAWNYLEGRSRAVVRRLKKQFIKARVPGDSHSRTYQEHRFPGMDLDDVRSRIARFGRSLDRFDRVSATPVTHNVIRIAGV